MRINGQPHPLDQKDSRKYQKVSIMSLRHGYKDITDKKTKASFLLLTLDAAYINRNTQFLTLTPVEKQALQG